MRKKPDRFNKVLKYYDWMSKISDLTDENIVELYELSNYPIIKEGNFSSFDKTKVISIINKRYKFETEIDEDGSIYIWGNIDTVFNDILKLISLCGWFISNIEIDNEWIIFKESEKYINITGVTIEPYRDLKIENIPSILYHVSESKYDTKIQRIGLIPKSNSKMSNHPDRIYLTDGLEKAKIIKMSFDNKYKKIHSIWEIHMNSLIMLYSDINLRDGGFYTMDNISPSNITRLNL
jgi:hypothetical protein